MMEVIFVATSTCLFALSILAIANSGNNDDFK